MERALCVCRGMARWRASVLCLQTNGIAIRCACVCVCCLPFWVILDFVFTVSFIGTLCAAERHQRRIRIFNCHVCGSRHDQVGCVLWIGMGKKICCRRRFRQSQLELTMHTLTPAAEQAIAGHGTFRMFCFSFHACVHRSLRSFIYRRVVRGSIWYVMRIIIKPGAASFATWCNTTRCHRWQNAEHHPVHHDRTVENNCFQLIKNLHFRNEDARAPCALHSRRIFYSYLLVRSLCRPASMHKVVKTNKQSMWPFM